MKKARRIIIALIVIVVFVFAGAGARADNIAGNVYEKSGAGDIYDALDQDSKKLINDIGLSEGIYSDMDSKDVLTTLSKVLQDKINEPIKIIVIILIITIICKISASLENSSISSAVNTIGGLAVVTAVLKPIIGLISSAAGLTQFASGFLLICIPVYTVLLIASGNTAAGASFSYMSMVTGNLIPVISSGFLIPVLNIFLALSVTSAISTIDLSKLAESIYKFVKWLLVFIVTIFTAIISTGTFLNSNIDAVSAKAAKTLSSSLIPVVGGVIGDSLSVVIGSVSIVKSGVGAFGIIASIVVFLPTVIEAVIWIAVCSIGEITADLFEMPTIGKFMAAGTSVSKLILALLLSVLTVCVICSAIVVFAKGAV